MERYAETTQQTYEGWDEFYSKPVDEKLEFFKMKGRIFDVIYRPAVRPAVPGCRSAILRIRSGCSQEPRWVRRS